MTICVVSGCQTGSQSHKGPPYQTFGFPKNEKLRNKWLKRINRKGFVISKASRVCERHFVEDYFIPDEDNLSSKNKVKKKRKLKELAVPSLFMRPEGTEEIVLKRITENSRKRILECEINNQPKNLILNSNVGSFSPLIHQVQADNVPVIYHNTHGETVRRNIAHDYNFVFKTEASKKPVIVHDLVKIGAEIEVEPSPPCDQCNEKDDQLKLKDALLAKKDTEIENLKLQLEIAKRPFPGKDQQQKLANENSKPRWSNETKMTAIQLYSRCRTSTYQFLVKDLKLPYPSREALLKNLAKIECEAGGVLEDFFVLLEEKVKKMDPKERFGSLNIDEMGLNPLLQYCLTQKKFIGHPTLPASKALIAKRKKQGIAEEDFLATHAMNALVCGISTRFKQLVGFHFTDNGIDVKAFANWIRMIVKRCADIKLRIVCLGLDMASSNQKL